MFRLSFCSFKVSFLVSDMYNFDNEVYNKLKQFWDETWLEEVVLVVKTANKNIHVLGNPESGQKGLLVLTRTL